MVQQVQFYLSFVVRIGGTSKLKTLFDTHEDSEVNFHTQLCRCSSSFPLTELVKRRKLRVDVFDKNPSFCLLTVVCSLTFNLFVFREKEFAVRMILEKRRNSL
jgi:hypothetical protein